MPAKKNRKRNYHQLPNHGLIKIFRTNIDALCNEIASIDMFLFHAALSFLQSSDSFFLLSTCFSFMFRLSTMLERRHLSISTSAYSEKGEIGSSSSRRAEALGTVAIAIWRSPATA